MQTTKLILHCLAAALLLGPAGAAGAYPEKPLRIVVPFPAGGASDAAARAIAQHLAKSLAKPVVVENRPGAGGSIAAQAVHASPADGYTLLWAPASMVSLPALMKSPPFASLGEFAPVSGVGDLPFCVYVHPQVPAKSVAELAAYARADPAKVVYGSGSIGEQLAGEQFAKASGAKLEQVPYKGGAQLMPDLVAGRLQANIGPASTGLPHVKSGRLRALAVLLPQRSPLLPDVPTAAEAGFPGLVVPTWQAVLAPPRTPRPVVDRLASAVSEALRDPETVARLDAIGLQRGEMAPEALATRIRNDQPVWTRFVRENGLQLD